jgi:hypothetical protein
MGNIGGMKPRKLGRSKRSKNKPNGRRWLALPQKEFRTAIGNGSRVLDGIDGRSHIARRHIEISASIAKDLGGANLLSEAQLQLIRSAAGLVILREDLDAKAADGERIDVATYCRISNSLRRVLDTIGLERRAQDITTLGDILREGIRCHRVVDEAEVQHG